MAPQWYIIGGENFSQQSVADTMWNQAASTLGSDLTARCLSVANNHLGSTITSLLEDKTTLGFNIARPHKRAAATILGSTLPVNTVYRTQEGWMYARTDARGLVQAARSKSLEPNAVLLIGCGDALIDLPEQLEAHGASRLTLNDQHPDRMARLKEGYHGTELDITITPRLSLEDLQRSDTIINATPCGMLGNPCASPIPLAWIDALDDPKTFIDANYRPLLTPMLAYAQERSHKVVEGWRMLALQAARSYRLSTGDEREPIERAFMDAAFTSCGGRP